MKARPFLLLIASSVFAVLLCEVGVRVLGFGGMMEFEPDPDWGYLMRGPQSVSVYGHPISINAEGMRGPEIGPVLPDGVTRILFVGDSVTYGGGRVYEEELFVRRVEAMAGDAGSTQAINGSAPGWSPQNWIRFVEKRGTYDADVIVAVVPEVDLARPFGTMELHGLRQNAPVLQLAWFVLKAWIQIAGPDTDQWQRVDPDEEARRNVAATERLLQIAEREGSAAIIVLVPSLPSQSPPERWSPYEQMDVPIIDLRPVLTEPRFFTDGVHLTPAGHEVVAEHIGPAVLATLAAR